MLLHIINVTVNQNLCVNVTISVLSCSETQSLLGEIYMALKQA